MVLTLRDGPSKGKRKVADVAYWLADVTTAATETEGGLLIGLGGGDSVLPADIGLADLSDDNFIF